MRRIIEPSSAPRMNDSISIIIPTRNRSAILAQCLALLPTGARGLEPPEVIVVDDCSSNETCKVVDQFRSETRWPVRCLRQNRPLGANAVLRINVLIYGVGGVIIPFFGIKLIDMILTALRLT